MPNLSTLAGRLLTQELGSEDSTNLFTDARRQAAINDGIREFADLTECYIKRSTIAIAGGTFEYDLLNSTLSGTTPDPADFIRLAADQSVEVQYTDASSRTTYVSGDDLPQRSVRWLDRYQPGWRDSTAVSSGMQLPSCFYLRTERGQLLIGFYPAPSTGSSASMKAWVPYVALPGALADSTDVPFTGSTGPSLPLNSSGTRTRSDLVPYHQALVHYAAHQLEKLRRDDQASDRQLQKFSGYVQRYLQAMRKKGGSAVTFARTYFRRGSAAMEGRDPRV